MPFHLGDPPDDFGPDVDFETNFNDAIREAKSVWKSVAKKTKSKTVRQRWDEAVSSVKSNMVSTGTPISFNGKTLSKGEQSFISSLVRHTKMNPGKGKSLSNDEVAYARELIQTVDDIGQLEKIARDINPDFDEDFGKMSPGARIDRIRERIMGQLDGNRQTLYDRWAVNKEVVDDGRTITEKAAAARRAKAKVSEVLSKLMPSSDNADIPQHRRLGMFAPGLGNIEHSIAKPGGKLAWDFSRATSLDELIEDMEKSIGDRKFLNPYGLTVDELTALKTAGAELRGSAEAGEEVSLRALRYGRYNDGRQLQVIRTVKRAEKAKILGQVADEWFGIDVETTAFQVPRDIEKLAGGDLEEIVTHSQRTFQDKIIKNTSIVDNLTMGQVDSILNGPDNNLATGLQSAYNALVGKSQLDEASRLAMYKRAYVAVEVDRMLNGTQFLPRISQFSGGAFRARNMREGSERLAPQLSGFVQVGDDSNMVDILGENGKGLSPKQMLDVVTRLEEEATTKKIYGINVVRADLEWIRSEAYYLSQQALVQGDKITADALLAYSGDLRATDPDVINGKVIGHRNVAYNTWDIQKNFRRFFPAIDDSGNNVLRRMAVSNVDDMARYESGLIFWRNTASQRWMSGDKGKIRADIGDVVNDIKHTTGRNAADKLVRRAAEITNRKNESIGRRIFNLDTVDDLVGIGDDADARTLLHQVEDEFINFMTLKPGDDIAVKYGDDAISRSLGNIAHTGAGASADFVRLSFFDEVVRDTALVRQLRHEAKQDVKFIRFMLEKSISHFAKTGEMISGVRDLSESDFRALEEAQEEVGTTFKTLLIGAKKNEEFPTIGFRGSFLLDDIKASGESYNMIEKAKALQRVGEFNKAGDKLGNPLLATSLGQHISEKYAGDAAKLLGKEFDEVIMSANRIAKRGMIGAIVGTAAVVAATQIKSNMNEDDTWRYSKSTYNPDQVRSMEQRLNDARLGNLAIATHTKRNYSNNMRNDKHSHLFGGRQ